MIIRWLNCFKRSSADFDLLNSLSFECGRQDEAAAERLKKGLSNIERTGVGLLLRNKNIVRSFKSDVCSKYDDDGKLFPNRRTSFKSEHKEVFVDMSNAVIGIVVRKDNLCLEDYLLAVEFATAMKLPLVEGV